MTIKDKEKKLFLEWRKEKGYQYFMSDGLFDEDEWMQQDIKLLFILKEANWENGDTDLCEFLLSETSSEYWKTWNNVARWTKAILEEGEYPQHISKADKSYWLRKISAMNLKKVGGDAVAEDECIRQYAKSDAQYLNRQIKLYNPDIIICCGRGTGKNADILHDIVFSKDEVSEWMPAYNSYNYFLYQPDKDKQVPVLSFYHPQMRGSHEKFKERYLEMLEIGKFFKNTYLWR